MRNPLNAFVSEAEETFKIVLIAILGFVILKTLGVALGMQAITKSEDKYYFCIRAFVSINSFNGFDYICYLGV